MNRALSSLKGNDAFREVFRKGRHLSDGALVLCIKENETGDIRLGVMMSKKCGNSVVRHRFSRIVRESVRLRRLQFLRGADLVVFTKKDRRFLHPKDLTFAATDHALLLLLRRAHFVG